MAAAPFDLISQDFKRDPLPTFERMRAEGPLVRTKMPMVGEVWLATTHEACSRILKDKALFVREPANAGRRRRAGIRWWMPRTVRLLADNMLGRDDPEHRRLRGLVDEAFRRRGVEAMRPDIERIADELIDDFAGEETVDLVARYARRLPLVVISELLGLPSQDRDRTLRWVSGFSEVSSAAGFMRVMPAIGRLTRYFRASIETARRSPGMGLISRLVEVEDEAGKLTDDELLTMIFVLFAAGHETTAHLLSGGTLAVLRHPNEKAALIADPTRMPLAIEECLRFVSPVQMTKPRFVARDVDLFGRTLKRGELVVALLASANADSRVFEAPQRFDPQRRPNPHLAFGTGVHFCLGLQLARAEGQVALSRLLARHPGLALAVPEGDLRWTRRLGLRALKALPVRLGEGVPA